MKCPYCDKEMNEGYMSKAQGDFRWTPKKERALPLYDHVYPYEKLLKKRDVFKNARIKVYRCADCAIEIINEKDLEVGD